MKQVVETRTGHQVLDGNVRGGTRCRRRIPPVEGASVSGGPVGRSASSSTSWNFNGPNLEVLTLDVGEQSEDRPHHGVTFLFGVGVVSLLR